MNTITIILGAIAFAASALLVYEIRRKAPAIEQDAAAMERKAMADLHGLWLDEIMRSRAMADHAAQDAQHARDMLGEKLDRMMVSMNSTLLPMQQRLGTVSTHVEKLVGHTIPHPAAAPVPAPESPLPDVNAAISAPAAGPAPGAGGESDHAETGAQA